MDTWNSLSLKTNEKKVFDAIQYLFKQPDHIEIFNKKAIYLYIRELTGLTTKQIVLGLKKFKSKYNYFVQRWNRGLITHLQVNGNEQQKELTRIN